MSLVLDSSIDNVQEFLGGFSGKFYRGLSVCRSPRISKLRSVFITVYFSTALLNRSPKRVEKILLPEIILLVDEDHRDFRLDQTTLSGLVKERNLRKLGDNGGVKKIALALKTELEIGINGDDEEVGRRVNAFGSNTYRTPPSKSFFFFAWEALKDLTILILLACAALSLGFGIKQHGIKEGWYDGGSIFMAVFIVIFFSAISNYRQNKQFEKLSKLSDDIRIEVLRQGRRRPVSIFNIVVGDIVCLKIGDQIPADGLLVDGYGLQVDESSMTGESDHVEVNRTENPFLISGTKVVDGFGQMIVTSVGMNTTWGEMMSSISRDTGEQTPLQARLNKLTSMIGTVGLTVASLVLVVLLVRFFTGNTEDENGNPEFVRGKTKFDDIINGVIAIIAAAVTIVVVAIPEGLPLAVTLTLAYSMKRMMADQAMVRKLSACETMGSATTICTDKTGTLTMNQMKVTKFLVGGDQSTAVENISQALLEIIHVAVGLNTTGSIYKAGSSESELEFSGSPTEKAILSWSVMEMKMKMEEITKNYTTLHVETFNSKTKRSGVLIKRNIQSFNNGGHVHWKGAAEMILAMCSSYYDINGAKKDLKEDEKVNFERTIEGMAASSLRCIAFAHAEIAEIEEEDEPDRRKLKEEGLTLIGIVGIKDPCRRGVRKAVESCQYAGVNVKMITGDNIFTAKAIATECGILRQNMGEEAVVDGAEFRSYTPEERLQKVDQIRVMARSSPFDKLLMVQCLKQKGHVVAVTGDGTNDAPALKEADIGVSMGIQGTEVAKESSDIVIMDDNFSSVVTVLKWGRCVYTNIQKFLQFQLTVNVAALVINFIAAVSAGEVPLTAVQLLWVNLIMDTLGALPLATEGPTKDLMDKKPVGRTEPLITNAMWRNLLAQAFYQIAILLALQFKGEAIVGVSKKVNETLIFNTFVLCQVFNEFNARKIEKRNVFKGLLKNKLFLGIVGFTVVLQVVMVEFLRRFAGTERLTLGEWGACLAMASVTWPIGWIVKLIPVPDTPILGYLEIYGG